MQVPDRFPKVELHLHLDCSLSYSLVSRLDPSITPARYEAEFVAPAKCGGLAEFLTRAPRQVDLMQTGEALRLAVEDLFEQLAKDAVLYVESASPRCCIPRAASRLNKWSPPSIARPRRAFAQPASKRA